jgi:transposase
MIYSLVETAKLNGVNPYYYLRYVLERMSAIPLFARESNAALDDLMPWSVKLQEAIRTYEKEKE